MNTYRRYMGNLVGALLAAVVWSSPFIYYFWSMPK